MASIQSGASLAKSMFPIIGAQGTTTLRLIFASIIMLLILRPWRVRMTANTLRNVVIYGMALGGMNFLFYMALQTVPIGIAVALEFTGPLAVAILLAPTDRLPVDCPGHRRPAAVAASRSQWPGTRPSGRRLCAGGWRVLGAVHPVRPTCRSRARHPERGPGVVVAALFVAPIGIAHAGSALLTPAVIPMALAVAILSTALPYSLEMVALTRIPARTFGTLMSIEPAFGALSGLLFLGEMLTLTNGWRSWHHYRLGRHHPVHAQGNQPGRRGRLI
jgi:inner membrane transporter RhtA